MSDMDPYNYQFILPSRFAVGRPCTWHLVMGDADRELAARYSVHVPLKHTPGDLSLQIRDRRMCYEVEKRRSVPTPEAINGGLLGPVEVLALQMGASSLQQHEAAEKAVIALRHAQGLNSYGIFPREVPTSLFH